MTDTTPPRRGLGRGLGSLIPSAPPAEQAPAPVQPGATIGPGDGGPAARQGAGTALADRPGTSPDWIGRLPGGAPPAQGRHAAQTGSPGHDGAHGTGGSAEAADHRPAADEADHGLGEVAGAWFAELPVEAIAPNARQPRQVFEEEALAELVHSIREVGLLQPVVVRRLPLEEGTDAPEQRYELVMGERRWRATQEAGLDTIPAIVRETGDDAMLRDALLENLHRVQLNPLEEAAAYQQLLEDFGCTHEDLAGRIGRSRPQISNTLRLLRLSPSVQRRVAAGVLSAGHARALLGVADADAQDRLASRVVAEGISVRALEEIVALGDHAEDKPATVRRRRPTSPALLHLADRLSDLFDTRVKVDLGRSKGKITIEYASLEDLDRIIGTIDPSYERRSDPSDDTSDDTSDGTPDDMSGSGSTD